MHEEMKKVVDALNELTRQMAKDREEIERLRDALYDIQDMPDDWESDEEMNLLFVIDTHVRIAKEALGMPTEAEEKK